jgi:ADP-dependent NAD(P)H-hydrate dehydratase / NAD(P)H-hydrate epimerase
MNRLWKNKVVTGREMKELDRKTIQEFGVSGEVLMESAARGAFRYIMNQWPGIESAAVFCGKGNNGGDGLVMARYLLNQGIELTVFLLARQKDLKGDAKLNLDRFLNQGGELAEIAAEQELEELFPATFKTDLIVDAIFGTGLDSEVKGLARKAIETINVVSEDQLTPVLAVDIPSGVNADNGQVMGAAVQADATVTFGLLKVGQMVYPGAECCGDLELIDIGIPSELTEPVKTFAIDDELAFAMLKPRDPDAHKGDNGHTLVLAGSQGKTGAAYMAGMSALRAGAGLVTLGAPASLLEIFEAKAVELMTEPLPDGPAKSFDQSSVKRARELMGGKDCVALGPGIGQAQGIDDFVREVLTAAEAPLVIDADGLNSLARQMQLLKKTRAPIILTPHPGEMARLSGMDAGELNWDRVAVARRFAQEWNVVLLLKGARTVVASPEGEVFINLSGNSGMASAGMGDVLTGIIAGLLSQGYEPLEAAALGAYLHGRAGDLALEDLGGIGIIASDLIDRIPAVRAYLHKQILGHEE